MFDVTREIVALTGVIALLLTIWRGQRQIHVLVNSQLTDVTNRVTQLEQTIRRAGLDIPADPAHPNRPTTGDPP